MLVKSVFYNLTSLVPEIDLLNISVSSTYSTYVSVNRTIRISALYLALGGPQGILPIF